MSELPQAISAGAAAVGLLYAGFQLYATRRDTRLARTYRYVERLYNREFVDLVAAARDFWSKQRGGAGHEWRLERYRRMSKKERAPILLVLNFFEEVAGAHISGLLDLEVFDVMLRGAAEVVRSEAGWLIDEERTRNPKHMSQLCTVVERGRYRHSHLETIIRSAHGLA